MHGSFREDEMQILHLVNAKTFYPTRSIVPSLILKDAIDALMPGGFLNFRRLVWFVPISGSKDKNSGSI